MRTTTPVEPSLLLLVVNVLLLPVGVTELLSSWFSELQALHEMVQQKVVTLLSDSENIVKQSLMENGITRLCVFFGRQKANDVLLSHMITFLNDKNDWHLRGAFFDSIVGKKTEHLCRWSASSGVSESSSY